MWIFQADGYFLLDYEAKEAKIYCKAPDFVPPEETDLSTVGDSKAQVGKMLISQAVSMGSPEPLRAGLESFVVSGSASEVSGHAARNAIAAAVGIVRQIKAMQAPSEERRNMPQ